MLVHFPIALITVGFVFDLFSAFRKNGPCLSKTGFWLETIGMAGAIVAFASGYFLTSPMEGDAGMMRDKHELFATIALITVIAATFGRMAALYLKKNSAAVRYGLLALIMTAFIFIAMPTYRGGSLVMDYMIGL